MTNRQALENSSESAIQKRNTRGAFIGLNKSGKPVPFKGRGMKYVLAQKGGRVLILWETGDSEELGGRAMWNSTKRCMENSVWKSYARRPKWLANPGK